MSSYKEETFVPAEKYKMNAICSLGSRLLKLLDGYLPGKGRAFII